MRARKTHRNYTPFIFGGAIIVLLLGFIFVFGRTSTTTTQGTVYSSTLRVPLPKESLVTLTNNGFSPNRVVVKAGTAVRWVNRSNFQQVSINSDDHPTHEKYPALNLGEFEKDSSVAYVFNSPGEYTYHDHFHPTFKGTIIVTK